MGSSPFAKIPDEFLADWQNYLSLRSSGLKKEGPKDLKNIIDKANSSDPESRNKFIDSICRLAFDQEEAVPLQYPLLEKLILPYLGQCLHQNLMPQVRWLYQTGSSEKIAPELTEYQILQKAIQLDPGDFKSWELLFNWNKKTLEYATHHLPDCIVLDLETCQKSLKEIDQILNLFPSLKFHHETWHATLKSVFLDWEEFSNSIQNDSFEKWCLKKGRNYNWNEI